MNEARYALVEALKVVGIKLEPSDDHAGRVMIELRRRGYRVRKLAGTEGKLLRKNRPQR